MVSASFCCWSLDEIRLDAVTGDGEFVVWLLSDWPSVVGDDVVALRAAAANSLLWMLFCSSVVGLAVVVIEARLAAIRANSELIVVVSAVDESSLLPSFSISTLAADAAVVGWLVVGVNVVGLVVVLNGTEREETDGRLLLPLVAGCETRGKKRKTRGKTRGRTRENKINLLTT